MGEEQAQGDLLQVQREGQQASGLCRRPAQESVLQERQREDEAAIVLGHGRQTHLCAYHSVAGSYLCQESLHQQLLGVGPPPPDCVRGGGSLSSLIAASLQLRVGLRTGNAVPRSVRGFGMRGRSRRSPHPSSCASGTPTRCRLSVRVRTTVPRRVLRSGPDPVPVPTP